MQNTETVEEVRGWLSTMVIGLGLCPFAEPIFKADSIRYAICGGERPEDLMKALATELEWLVDAPRAACETTLLIAPRMLPDFLDFNDFVGTSEQVLKQLNLIGTIQIVGFHPLFQFGDASSDAPENYTNRSPFPLLHLLREESITEVNQNGTKKDQLLEIPSRNTATLRNLGIPGIIERMSRYRRPRVLNTDLPAGT